MPDRPTIDLCLNVFAKPYQTALSVLSLLRFSGGRIGRVYLQFEPYGSAFDSAPPYAVAEYLGDRAVVSQPRHWLKLDPTDVSRLADPEYRLSIRYQHAFEHSSARYLLTLHNDVLVMRDIAGAMLDAADGAFAVGGLGQCWNCPAADAGTVRAAGLGDAPCSPDRYRDFRPDYAGLQRLYQTAVERGVFVRPYWEGWQVRYAGEAWPLPECRINEWACLVDLEQTRPLVAPAGDILPFGSFEACGTICLDTAVAWFRDLHRRGLHARHLDTGPYLRHWVGNGKMTRAKYLKAEANARAILEKSFRPFADWCKERGNGLFI